MSKKPPSSDARYKRDKRVFLVILVTFFVTFILLAIRIFTLEADSISPSGRSLADYVTMALQCLLGIALMFLPSLAAKKLTLHIPSSLYAIYVVFLYFAIYLGEVWHFFYKFKYWDVLLHGFSAVSLGALGFSVVSFLNKDEHVRMSLSPLFVSIFSFCFALALGSLWEICEFTIDGLLGVNMQKFALEDGTDLIGRTALSDTMWDLVVDSAGALLASALGYFTLRRSRHTTSSSGDSNPVSPNRR